MGVSSRRRYLDDVEPIARELRDLVASYVGDVTIAGSIRRREPMVADIELLAFPKMIPEPGTMFAAREIPATETLIQSLKADRRFSRVRGSADGQRYKRFQWQGLPVDLFVCLPPATPGVLLAIRTGPAEFARWFVTPREKGGALPDGLAVRGGQLWDGDTPIPTPTEADFFAAIGFHWQSPECRNSPPNFIKYHCP